MPVREWEEIQEMLWRANDESIIRQAPRSPEGLRIGCRRCLTILSHQRELNLRKTPSRQGENHGVLQQTGTALLDKGKVKCRGVGDRLNMVVRAQVGIGYGNRGELPRAQARDCLGEHKARIEIGIVVAARPEYGGFSHKAFDV